MKSVTMKSFIVILTFCFSILLFGVKVDDVLAQDIAQKAIAVEINEHATWELNGSKAPSAIFDKSLSTNYTPTKDSQLVIRSTEEIQYVYMQFNGPPSNYYLAYSGKRQNAGMYGFLHELIQLDNPTNELIIYLNDMSISSITLFSSGTLPTYVELWEPPYEKADMLVFPTHADDDVLYFGGAIATYANQHKKIQVAFLCNNDKEKIRNHEMLAGLWEMGVTAYPIFGEFPDIYSRSIKHAASVFDKEAIYRNRVELIRRFKPDVLLLHDVEGEYGHGAHMLNTQLSLEAIEHSGDSSVFPESAVEYGTSTPLKTYIHLYDTNTIYLKVDTPLEHLNNRTALEKAQDGFSKHISQFQWEFVVSTVGSGDIRKFGLIKSSVGLDTTNDMFENLPTKPSKPNVEEPDFLFIMSEQMLADIVSLPDANMPNVSKPRFGTNTLLLILLSGLIVSISILWIYWNRKPKRK
jgi:LmbE family N-acetylglucosaminyl deacetylase